MPDEIVKSYKETNRRLLLSLWKLPQQPARKLASEVASLSKEPSNDPAAVGTRIALIRAEPIFE